MKKAIVSHAVQMIVPRFLEDGTVMVAMMPYTKGYGTKEAFTTLRLPTETRRNGEGVKGTALRGVRDEVAKDKSHFVVEPWGLAYVELCQDQADPNGLHAKVAMVMAHVSGDLRDHGAVDEDDADEHHGPMEWVDIRKVLEGKTRLRSIRSHKVALCAFLRTLVESPEMGEVGKRYYDLVDHFLGPGLRDEGEREGFRAYMA